MTKAVILAGGLGTRLSEETHLKPKPMVEIGGRPILWHIMKIYAAHGINEFIICTGYKGYIVKEYFANYPLHMSDVTFDFSKDSIEVHQRYAEPWRITLVDTGMDSQTGGRLGRVREYIGDEDFCFTYGDGVADIDVSKLIGFHRAHGARATVTGVQPQSRFGTLEFDGDKVTQFEEKPPGEAGWINGGFFVLSPKVLDLIDGDQTIWESGPLQRLVADEQLRIFKHKGFWRPMDTLRDKHHLEALWQTGEAPWKCWS